MIREGPEKDKEEEPRYRGVKRPRRQRQGTEHWQTLLLIGLVVLVAGILSLKLTRRAPESDSLIVNTVTGHVRRALSTEVARRLSEPGAGRLAALAGGNPFDFTDPLFAQYAGLRRDRADRPQSGHWYFDARLHDLVYVVRQRRSLQTVGPYPDEVRFYLALVYEDRDADGRYSPNVDEARNVELRTRYAYSWAAADP